MDLRKIKKLIEMLQESDLNEIEVKEGEILIIPKGVEHRPRTNGEVVLNMLFEPKTTLHTGNIETNITVKKLDWI